MGYDYLREVYYDPRHPGSLGGVEKLYRAVRKEGKYVLGRAQIRQWLRKQETFTLHQQVRRNFRRQRVIVPYIDYQWDADTAVLTTHVKENDGYGFFLLIIDVFSRYVWTVPLRTTKAAEMVQALKLVLEEGRSPQNLRTDKGVEFKNKEVKKLMEQSGIYHFFTQNESKVNYAERTIKNMKSRLSRYRNRNQSNRWMDVLSEVTHSYNTTYHRIIKRAPERVKKRDEAELWQLQYGARIKSSRARLVEHPLTRFKFRVGDRVRISHLQHPFQREYDERWTYEYFVVASRGMKQGLSFYTLKDVLGDAVDGTFYDAELSEVLVMEDTPYRIEKVLKKKRSSAFVKWWGWPKKFNS